MPNRNAIIAQRIEKGDVIWVPYRQDPMWPALVNNVYPKKVSYCFFPLSPGDELRKSRFSCATKLTFAFDATESLPKNADANLKKAYKAASEYLAVKGKTRGSKIPSFKEAGAENKRNRNHDSSKFEKERKTKRKANKSNEELLIDGFKPLCVERKSASFSDQSIICGSQQQLSATEEQSKAMMRMIDDQFDALVNDIWKSKDVAECFEQKVSNEMTIQLKNNQFISESDYNMVFERIFAFICKQTPSPSIIAAFNITASHIIPHVLISCYSKCKNLDYQTTKNIYNQLNPRVLGLDSSMSIPVTDHLEELCRLACDESDAILN